MTTVAPQDPNLLKRKPQTGGGLVPQGPPMSGPVVSPIESPPVGGLGIPYGTGADRTSRGGTLPVSNGPTITPPEQGTMMPFGAGADRGSRAGVMPSTTMAGPPPAPSAAPRLPGQIQTTTAAGGAPAQPMPSPGGSDPNHPAGPAPAAPPPPANPRYTNPDGSPGAEIPKPDPSWLPNKQGNAWVPPGHPDAAGGAPGGAQGAGAPGAPASLQDVFKNTLLEKLGQKPGDVSVDSPEIAAAVRANRTAEDRNLTRQMMRLGEAGGDAASRETNALGLMQARAGREAGFEGGQVADLARQRQQELMSTLALAGNTLSSEQQLAAQKELAALDASIRQAGIAQQGQLGNRDLDIRNALGQGNLNLGLLGLLQGGQHFNQNLGAQLGMFGAGLNQNALLQLLGGLG